MTRGRKLMAIPHDIDWNKSDIELSGIHNVCNVTVGKWRKSLGIKRHHGGKKQDPDTKWNNVDWGNLRDVDIAEQFKLSRERVRQIREKYNFPRSLVNHCRHASIRLRIWMKEN